MENIVNFPTKSVRDWLIIERALYDALKQAPVSASVEQRLVEKMKSFYQIMQRDFNFAIQPIEAPLPQAQLNAICSDIGKKMSVALNEQIHAFTNEIFFERFNREVEVCREIGIL